MKAEARFDAYAASLRGVPFDEVVYELSRQTGGLAVSGHTRRRYGVVADINVGARMAAWVGEDQANGCIYVEAKGETTPEFVDVIRDRFPLHSVARADPCADFDGEGVFDYLLELAREVKGEKVRAGYVALPDDPSEGRTYAMGRRGGVAYARLYEAGKHPDKAHWCRPNAVRFEVEVRPHYARDKAAAARMQPLEFFGFAGWSKRVAEAILEAHVPRFAAEVKASTHDRTTLYLARAFRRHWDEMLSDFGDWECIGRELESVWREDDEMAATLALRRSEG